MLRLTEKLMSGGLHHVNFVATSIFRSNLKRSPANNEIFQVRTKRRRPIKVFVCFQASTRVSGASTVCKRVFDHTQLTRLRVVLNSTQQFPEREYQCKFSFAEDDYARVYDIH